MRILLSSANFCNSPYVVYPLGIGVLASALSQAGHEVRQFDPLSLDDYQAHARALLQDFRPELIGVSIRNLDDIDSRQITDRLLGESLDVIRFFRAEAPGVPMALGGGLLPVCRRHPPPDRRRIRHLRRRRRRHCPAR